MSIPHAVVKQYHWFVDNLRDIINDDNMGPHTKLATMLTVLGRIEALTAEWRKEKPKV